MGARQASSKCRYAPDGLRTSNPMFFQNLQATAPAAKSCFRPSITRSV